MVSKTVVFDSSYFNIEYSEFLKKHEIVYERPAVRPEDYLPIGNGRFGMMVDPFGSQKLGGRLAHYELWGDFRTEEEKNSERKMAKFSELRKLYTVGDIDGLEKLEKEEMRSLLQHKIVPIVAGRVSVDIVKDDNILNDICEVSSYSQKLSLYNAEVVTSFKWDTDVLVKTSSFVYANKDILALRFNDLSKKQINRVISLIKIEDRQSDKMRYSAKASRLYLEYEIQGGIRYVAGIDVSCAASGTASVSDDSVAYKTGKYFDSTVDVFVSIASTVSHTDPFAEVNKNLDFAVTEGFLGLQSKHREWWAEFWSKSFIEVSDADIENAWYFHNYLIASSSRGELPSPLCMLWATDDKWPWAGCYFDMNISLMYYSSLMINHSELMDPYHNLYLKHMPDARWNAKELFEAEGLYYPHNMSLFTAKEMANLWWRLQNYHSALAGVLFWWTYLYRQDEEQLGDWIYPFMKDVGLFYESFLVEDEKTGYLKMPAPACTINEENRLEFVFRKENDPFDMAIVKRLFMGLVEASEILDADENKRAEWKEIIGKISPIANNGDIFLAWENEDPRRHSFCVADTVGPIFPAAVVDMDDPKCLNTVFDAIMSGFAQCFSFPWIASACAWMGFGYLAARCLHGQFQKFVLPSGQVGESGAKGFPYVEEYGRNVPGTLISESSPAISAAICQMLLRSLYDGVIRVFNAVPASWEARFAGLAAVGGFDVSSEFSNGKVEYIGVTSKKGKVCKILLPKLWDIMRISVKNAKNGNNVEFNLNKNNGIIEFNTSADSSYFILPYAEYEHEYCTIGAYVGKPNFAYVGIKKKEE